MNVIEFQEHTYTPDDNEVLRRLGTEAAALLGQPVPAEDVLWLLERNRLMWIALHENDLIAHG